MHLTPRLHLLTIPFTIPLPAGPVRRTVNVVLHCGPTITLVDSGVAGAEMQIFAYLRQLGRTAAEIDTLVLTHSHPDHLGAAAAIVAASGCRVAAHPAERAWIEDPERQLRERPVPGFRQLVGGAVAVDRWLADGDRLDLGEGERFEVLHTPGHSAGSLSLWHPGVRGLLVGDAVPLPGAMPIFDDVAASLAAVDRLAQYDAEWLLSAWDEPRRGTAVGRRLDEGRCWLERLRQTVRALPGAAEMEPLVLCRAVAAQLGLPAEAVNPLVARSLFACLRG